MATTLEAIRAKLKAQNTNVGNQPAFNRGNDIIFPFWNAPDNSTSTIRFLPDGDENNTFFWVDKQSIKLTFDDPREANGKKYVVLPSLTTWGEKCKLKERASEEYQKRKSAEKRGEEYEVAKGIWPKTTSIFQGIVIDTPIKEEVELDSPLRLFLLNGTLAKIVKDSLMDTELENHPCDAHNGHNFRIKKTKKGEYADYSTSGFAYKSSTIPEEIGEELEGKQLFNLTERLGEKPTPETHEKHLEILNAYIEGEDWNEEWDDWVK